MRLSELISTPIVEGIHDPAIFKAIFIIGGPGSGKSYVARQLGLNALGFVNINSDVALSYLMKKSNLNLKMPPEEHDLRANARARAKDLTIGKFSNSIEGRLGLIIDGTGEDYTKTLSMAENLHAIGYETFLIVVNTNLDIAKSRNAARERSVPNDILEKKWHGVQQNIGKFTRSFKNHKIIDNNGDGPETQSQIMNVYKDVVKWANHSPSTPKAKEWLNMMKPGHM